MCGPHLDVRKFGACRSEIGGLRSHVCLEIADHCFDGSSGGHGTLAHSSHASPWAQSGAWSLHEGDGVYRFRRHLLCSDQRGATLALLAVGDRALKDTLEHGGSEAGRRRSLGNEEHS